MATKKKSKFEKLITKTEQFLDGKFSYNKYIEYIDKNIEIKPYIPLYGKYGIIKEIQLRHRLMDVGSPDSLEEAAIAIQLEQDKFFWALLKWTDLKIEKKEDTTSRYDMLVQSGFADYVLSKCGRDYERFERMLKETLGLDDMIAIKGILSSLDDEKMSENVKTITKLMSDREFIQSMGKVISFNEPYGDDIRKLAEEAIKVKFEENKETKESVILFDKLKEDGELQEKE